MISNTFGAPLGGTICARQQGLESVAFRLMVPPKSGGGDGTYLPSMVVVALVEHGTPVVCWAVAVKAASRNITEIALRRTNPPNCIRVCMSLSLIGFDGCRLWTEDIAQARYMSTVKSDGVD